MYSLVSLCYFVTFSLVLSLAVAMPFGAQIFADDSSAQVVPSELSPQQAEPSVLDRQNNTLNSSPNNSLQFPGQEVTTQSGTKVKLWSTVGPVPVEPAPQPFDRDKQHGLSGSQIIVDTRKSRER